MERLILRAMDKDPAKRPQTAEQFREELLAVPAQARSAARTATPVRSTPVPRSAPLAAPRGGGRGFWFAGAATAALAVLGIAAAVSRPPPRAPPATSASAPAGRDAGLARTLVAQSGDREQAGNLAAARDLLEAALAADPDNAEAHYRLANLLAQKDPSRARAEYEASRKLDPVRYGDTVARILDNPK